MITIKTKLIILSIIVIIVLSYVIYTQARIHTLKEQVLMLEKDLNTTVNINENNIKNLNDIKVKYIAELEKCKDNNTFIKIQYDDLLIIKEEKYKKIISDLNLKIDKLTMQPKYIDNTTDTLSLSISDLLSNFKKE